MGYCTSQSVHFCCTSSRAETISSDANFNSDSNRHSNLTNNDNNNVSFIVICVCITLIVCCGITLSFVCKYFTYKLKLVSKSDNSKQNEQEMVPIGSNDKNNNKNNTNGDDTTTEPRFYCNMEQLVALFMV